MALSARSRRKHIDKASTLLPQDGFRPLDYALGGGATLPPRLVRAAVLGGWVVLTVVASLALKTFFAVGVLPMVAVLFAVNKPRGVLLTDRGLASFQCGFFNGQPTALLGSTSLAALAAPGERRAGSTRLQIAGDQPWLPDKDLARFRAATASAAGGPPPTPAG